MLPTALKIYLAIEPVDMSEQFNGLWSLAEEKLRENPRGGAVFVFVNKDRDCLKMLYFEGTGPWVLAKRLERGGVPGRWHSLATELLSQGASLPQIGRILRHRDLSTTAICAKVEMKALRPLAMAWPGGAR